MRLLLVIVVLGLAACSSNGAYLQSKTTPPLQVPQGLEGEALGDLFVVPEGDGRIASGEFKNPFPPVLLGKQRIDTPKIRNFDGQSWLVVPRDAATTWSQLLLYLRSRQFATVQQNVLDASIETDWIVAATDPGTAVRYKLTLEPGLNSELTEIHVVNRVGSLSTPITAGQPFPAVSEDEIHEKWLLNELARNLDQQQIKGDSLLASSISFDASSRATSVNGEPVIRMTLSPRRAFDALLNVLSDQSNKYELYDTSASESIIYFDLSEDNALALGDTSFGEVGSRIGDTLFKILNGEDVVLIRNDSQKGAYLENAVQSIKDSPNRTHYLGKHKSPAVWTVEHH